jgi:magnesium-transporting ATPase (P-type)
MGVDPRMRQAFGSVSLVFPFDPRRRRMSAVADAILHVKGAPDAVLPRCVHSEAAEGELQRMAEVAQAIAACRRAGIKVGMVTGDHPATARTIGSEVGLLTPDALVIQGQDLPADEALLGALVDRDGIVLSRVTPEDGLQGLCTPVVTL